MTGVVLFGPPAAGKDTIGAALARCDRRFRPVVKLKVGTGRTTGYRMVTAAEFDAMYACGRVVGVSERYGNRYGVDAEEVRRIAESGCVPVLHSGRLADLDRTVDQLGGSWFAVLLWCDRDCTERRSRERGDADGPARLAVWEEARAELRADRARSRRAFALAVRTDRVGVSAAAGLIARRALEPGRPDPGVADLLDGI